MEHKLDELQSEQRQLSQSNLSKPTDNADLQHELLQLTAANEVSTKSLACCRNPATANTTKRSLSLL